MKRAHRVRNPTQPSRDNTSIICQYRNKSQVNANKFKMKKISIYILILIALIGVFGTTEYANAQATGRCFSYPKTSPTGRHNPNNDIFENCESKNTPNSFYVYYWTGQRPPPAAVVTPPVVPPAVVPPPAAGAACTVKIQGQQQQGTWTNLNNSGFLSCIPNENTTNQIPTATTPAPVDPNYTFLAPLPCADGVPGCVGGKLITFDPTSKKGETNTNLGKYLNIMIRIIIGLCAVAAVAMIVIGGIQYMTSELMSSKEDGKERMKGAVWGLIIVLGSYALLYTINPDLLNSDVEIQDVTIYVDLSGDSAPQIPVGGKYTDRNGQIYDTAVPANIDWVARAGPETPLPTGVTVLNPSKCITVGQPSCTSIRGFNPSIINHILNMCKDCKTLSIQGATEFWLHGGSPRGTSHQINSGTVDLGTGNPVLNSYIRSGACDAKTKWCQKDGMWYLDEGNHWHASGNSKS